MEYLFFKFMKKERDRIPFPLIPNGSYGKLLSVFPC
jgi:hypothetical protein